MEEIQYNPLYKFGASKVVVGIPCYNEERSIAKVVLQARAFADEIIVCDDGSTDMTADIAKSLGAMVIRNERNLGKGVALRNLFLSSRETDAAVLVTIDGDGQHDCRDIPNLVFQVLKNGCDIAIGSRFRSSEDSSEMPKYRKVGSSVINSVVRKTVKTPVKDTQSGLRAYSKKALALILPGEHGFAVETEILHLAAQAHLKVEEFPSKIKYKDLDSTSTQNPVPHSIEVIVSTIKYVSLRHPLTFYGLASLASMLVATGFGIWTAIEYNLNHGLPFGPALATVGFFIISIILAAIAIILYSLTTIVRENSSPAGMLPWQGDSLNTPGAQEKMA